MIDTLRPIFRHLEDGYEAVRISVELAGEPRLGWKPAPQAKTFAEIAQHIASGNLAYATVIGPDNVRRTWELNPSPTKDWLLSRLDESLAIARNAVAGVTEESLYESRSDDWRPNCDEQEVKGPLDALWFTQQMDHHTAYHLGQLNLYLQLLGNDGG